jgi:hypothetical protein
MYQDLDLRKVTYFPKKPHIIHTELASNIYSAKGKGNAVHIE